MRVGVVDLGMGNLRSAARALAAVGAEVMVGEEDVLRRSDALVLPGVGHFGAASARLFSSGLAEALVEAVGEGRPLLGICLGMQLLFEEGEEGPARGLGLLPGKVARLPEGLKVPHMGWNQVEFLPFLPFPAPGGWFYFVHSYRVLPAERGVVAGVAEYGGEEIVAAVGRGAVVGFQFHPEKSSSRGLELLKAWVDWASRARAV